MSRQPKHWEFSAAVRDAVGLTSDQKAFLWNITSHTSHVEFGTRHTIQQRTGLTDHRFRQVVASLKSFGLIDVQEQPGGTTRYTMRLAALKALQEPGNPAAIANGKRKRKPPIRPVSAAAKPPRRLGESGRVDDQHGTLVGHRHLKAQREGEQEDQREQKDAGTLPPRRRTVRIPRHIAARNGLVGDHDA